MLESDYIFDARLPGLVNKGSVLVDDWVVVKLRMAGATLGAVVATAGDYGDMVEWRDLKELQVDARTRSGFLALYGWGANQRRLLGDVFPKWPPMLKWEVEGLLMGREPSGHAVDKIVRLTRSYMKHEEGK